MSCSRPLALLTVLLTTMLTLAACGTGELGGQAQADAQTRAACRKRADAVYDQQHRADIYSPPPAINTPSSGTYVPGEDSSGLAQIFIQDRMVSDCIRNSGTGVDRAQPPAQP
jgi:hypothetical protein